MFSIIRHMPVTYGNYEYPSWAIGLGWLYAMFAIIPIPLTAITLVVATKGSLYTVSFLNH